MRGTIDNSEHHIRKAKLIKHDKSITPKKGKTKKKRKTIRASHPKRGKKKKTIPVPASTLSHLGKTKTSFRPASMHRQQTGGLTWVASIWRMVRATRLSRTGPRLSCSRWISSMITSRTSCVYVRSPAFLVMMSHFSGVVTITCKYKR